MIGPVLHALERLRDVSERVTRANLGLTAMATANSQWFIADGHLTHVPVPFLDCEDESEVMIDEGAGHYHYFSLQRSRCKVTRPLAEIILYQINLNAILDSLASLLNIRQTATSRRQCLVPGHLWYLGEYRIGKTQASAPIFYGRALSAAPAGLLQEKLTSSIHEHAGIVLTPSIPTTIFATRHPPRLLDDFLYTDDGSEFFDTSALTRVLADVSSTEHGHADEWFDEVKGRLKLRHLAKHETFVGFQKNIIALFWRARDGDSLEWTQDVKSQSGSVAPTLDKAMGGKERRELFIEHTGTRGCYRLRRS
jgi:hypothetical protein